MLQGLVLSLFAAITGFFPASEIREDIDDFLDKIENKLDAKLTENPNDVKAKVLKSTIEYGRDIVGIPDDTGGDED